MKRVREKTRSEYYGRDEAGGGDQYRRKETIARQEGFERGQQCTRRLMPWWGRGGVTGGRRSLSPNGYLWGDSQDDMRRGA